MRAGSLVRNNCQIEAVIASGDGTELQLIEILAMLLKVLFSYTRNEGQP